MAAPFTYSELDFDHPDPSRMIDLPPQEPQPKVSTPEDDELFTRLDRDSQHSKRWRGIVGTFIADQLGLDVKERPYHLTDWPAGYSLWRKRRATRMNQFDIYLYGFGGRKKYSSPQEFAFHAFWLYVPDFNQNHPCPCVLHNSGLTQGQVTRNWLDQPPRFVQKKRGTPRSVPSSAGPSERVDNSVHGYKSRLFKFTTTGRESLDKMGSRGHQIKQPRDRVAPQRDTDLTSSRHFRVGELVWVSIPTLEPERPQDSEDFIAFWPALIREVNLEVRVVPGPPRTVEQRHKFTVFLLAVESNHVVEESVILSWHAYQLPQSVRSAMQRVLPDYPITPKLEEFQRFRLLPAETQVYPNRLSPAQEAAKPIPRTYAHALPILAVARRAGIELAETYWLTDSYDDTTKAAKTKYQGIWWGAERIWMDDLVRLVNTRTDLEENFGANLLEASPGAETRGLLARILEVTFDADLGEPVFWAHLYELEVVDGDCMEVEPKLEETSLPQPAALSKPARLRPGEHGYPLPPAPPNFRFRRISKPDQSLYLPLTGIAGRYDPLPMQSSEHATLLSHIINDENVAKYNEGTTLGRSLDRAFKRILSISGLLDGQWSQGDPRKPANRETAAYLSVASAKSYYYDERWTKASMKNLQ